MRDLSSTTFGFFMKQFLRISSIYQTTKSGAGFTLIETLVVISVITALSAVGLGSFLSYNRTQSLQQAAQDLKTTIERARANSLARIKPTGTGQCTTSESLYSYRIDTCTNCATYTYKMAVVCGSGAPRTIDILTKKLSSTMSITSTSCSSLAFNVLSNIVVCNSGSLPATIVLSGYNDTRTITVDIGGNVRIN